MEFKLADFLDCDLTVKRIVRVYRRSDEAWHRDVHIKRDCEGLLYFIRGGIHYDFDVFSFDALEGELLKLPSGIPYSGTKIGNGTNEFYVIDFVTDESDGFLKYPFPLSFKVKSGDDISERFKNIDRCFNEKQPFYNIKAKIRLQELLMQASAEYMDSVYGKSNKNTVLSICEYIKSNAFNKALTAGEIADRFYISETHLRRIFAKELKISPMKYAAGLRINEAKRLLISDIPICEIAEKCGFSSVYYFSSAFKDSVGISATEYRGLMQKQLSCRP